MTGAFNKTLFCVCDLVSKRRFLVDTGAEISVLPATRFDRFNRRTRNDLAKKNRCPSALYRRLPQLVK